VGAYTYVSIRIGLTRNVLRLSKNEELCPSISDIVITTH